MRRGRREYCENVDAEKLLDIRPFRDLVDAAISAASLHAVRIAVACFAVFCFWDTADGCDYHWRDPAEMIAIHSGPKISARRLFLRGDAYLDMARRGRFRELGLASAKEAYLKAISDFSDIMRLSPSSRYAAVRQRGIAYFEMGDYNKAITDLTAAIELSPDTGTFRLLRGAAYYLKGDFNNAAKDFEFMRRFARVGDGNIEPVATARVLELARQRLSGNGPRAEAARLYVRGFAGYAIYAYYRPDPQEEYFWHDHLGDLGLSNFRAAKRLDPARAAEYDYMIVRALTRDDRSASHGHEAVDSLIAEMIRRAPGSAEYHALRGDALGGRPGGAIDSYGEAVRLAPNAAEYRVKRAKAYLLDGQDSMAVADIIEAVRSEPDRNYDFSFFGNKRGDLYRKLALAFPDNAEYHAGMGDFDMAIRLAPDNAGYHYMKGAAHLARKDFIPALAAFGEAIRLSPGSEKYLIARGGAYIASGADVRAYAVADFVRAMHMMDHPYRGKLDDDTWNEVLSELIRTNHRQKARVYYIRGGLAVDKKDYGNALADISEAITLASAKRDNAGDSLAKAGYLAARAHIHLTVGDTAKAITDYAERERLLPYWAKIIYNDDDNHDYRSLIEYPDRETLERMGIWEKIIEELGSLATSDPKKP